MGKTSVDEYLSSHIIKKLHLGCGDNVIDGWLNTDLHPHSVRVAMVDVAKGLNFETNTFDFVFHEHLIEHLSYPTGLSMLMECYRVLKPNGILRVVTPNLLFLVEMYKNFDGALEKEYIKWATDTFIPTAAFYDVVFVINNFMRDWGHLFIYDENVLRRSLQKAGFIEIVTNAINESSNPELRHLENIARMPPGFLQLESMVLEAKKTGYTEP